jgi:hypothetical protein
MLHFMSVLEDDFPLINPSIWPSGCLITPFYSKLMPDQHFTLIAPDAGIPPASISPINPSGNDEAAEALPHPTL